jgi:hypothetical protein
MAYLRRHLQTVLPDPPVAKLYSASFEEVTGEFARAGPRNVGTVTHKKTDFTFKVLASIAPSP